MFNIGKHKMATDNSKLIQAEVEIVHSHYIAPRFNRRIAVNSYTGTFAAAIDYNAQAAASGTLRLHSKVRNSRGQKCLYGTIKHPNLYQRDYFKGLLEDKPASEVQYKQMDSPEGFEIVQDHPITQLFMSANPMQSTYQLFLDIYLNMQITGDAFIFVVSNADGTPAQLYVLQSQYIDIVPGKTGSDKLVSHYEYNRGKGKVTSFEEDEIIHIKIPNPNSIYYGIGVIEKGWQAFLINKFSHEYAAALYSNHAVPSYVLINKSGNSVSKKRFLKSLRNFNWGPKRAGKVMGIDGDIDIKEIAFKPADMQDTKLTTVEIASVTGCPINILSGETKYSNAPEQNKSWLAYTIHPVQKLVASTLAEKLLRMYGIQEGDAFLAYDSPVPADREYELKSNTAYVDNVFTKNEVRISLGKEPMEGGDALYHNGSDISKEPEPVDNPFNSSPENNDDSKMKQVMSDIDSIVKKIEINENKEVAPAPLPFTININNESLIEEVIDEE